MNTVGFTRHVSSPVQYRREGRSPMAGGEWSNVPPDDSDYQPFGAGRIIMVALIAAILTVAVLASAFGRAV